MRVLRSGLALVLLVGSLLAGMVYNSGPAQADGVAEIAKLSVLAGTGVRAAAPAALTLIEGGGGGAAALCVGPQAIGCAVLGVAAVGTAAYLTRDTWMPYVQEKWDEIVNPNETGPGKPIGQIQAWLTKPKGVVGQNTFSVQVVVPYVNNQGDQVQVPVVAELHCSNGGVTYAWGGWSGSTPNFTFSFADGCSTAYSPGENLESVKVAARTSGPIEGEPSIYTGTLEWTREAGQADEVTLTTVCEKPGGGTYNVVRTSKPSELGVIAGACTKGDIAKRLTGVPNKGTGFDYNLAPTESDLRNYPLCAGGGCGYQVFMDSKPCAVGRYPCTQWTEIARTEPERVTCHYGPYKVPVKLCNMLERVYENGETDATKPNTDGNPNTWTKPGPSGQTASQPDAPPRVNPDAPPVTEPVPNQTIPDGTGGPAFCASAASYNLGKVRPETARLVSILAPMFSVSPVYGWRQSDPTADDHPNGVAADFMVGTDKSKGQQVASYAQAHATELGVQYIIWQQHIWNVDRASEGWRLMPDRGSLTANHMDHVHITVKVGGSTVVPPCVVEPGGGDSDCSAGWTWDVVEIIVKPSRCVLRWAFVPREDVVAGALSDFSDVWQSRPPGNVITAAKPVFAGIGDGWGGTCVMPDFSMDHDGSLRLPCSPASGGPGSAVYTAIQAALIIATLIYLWGMATAAVGARDTGAGD